MTTSTINAAGRTPVSVSAPVCGGEKTLTLEAGKLAGLATGAVTVQLGDTRALVTATAAKQPRDGASFFPLTVDVEERMYAAGRIPGSFFRREGRASDEAILTCRLIDRPLRPNFPDAYRHETHVVGTILGVDGENPHDIITLNGASAALWLSGIPFESPIGGVRLAYSTEGTWIAFPTYEESEEATFEMVVAGRVLDGGDVAVMMVEAGGTERSFELYAQGAPKVTEAVLAEGLDAAKGPINDIVELQHNLRASYEAANGPVEPIEWIESLDYSPEVLARVTEVAEAKLTEVLAIADKATREAAQSEASDAAVSQLRAEFSELDDAEHQISAAMRTVAKSVVRRRIVSDGFRIDGRATDQVRPLSAEVGYLSSTAHGSGLFQRGETQVLNVTTLAMTRMEQIVDTLTPQDRKRYLHHYNFPPYSTGEAGFMRGPKRREIGHGALAERALLGVIPSKEKFPYVLRLVSDVLSSNGSTSMASVCASSLSLMDAGVPIVDHVAGVAMGLVHADDRYVTLTDILGAEDAFGDMDFKVAGTEDAITALQLDTKIDGIPADVLASALDQARQARMQILGVMREAIAEPRAELAETAPKITTFEIPMDKIAEVIGPRGKVINAIQDETGVQISVDDDGVVGTVSIGSADRVAMEEAERQVRLIANPPTASVGATYTGRVVNITKFGAFVNILPGTDGLLHISKLGGKRRVERVEEFLSLGDEVTVVVEDIDRNGKLSLSMADGAADDGSADAHQAVSDRSAVPSADAANGAPGGDNGFTDDAAPPAMQPTAAEPAMADTSAAQSAAAQPTAAQPAAAQPAADQGTTVRRQATFEDHFDAEAREVYGDLGATGDRGEGRGRRRTRN